MTGVVRLRLVFGDDAMLGPGKANLLRLIGETRPIAAAGRAMGMGYRRAWSLVAELNRLFREPLVESARRGSGGGAVLTGSGQTVLELEARGDGQAEIGELGALLADMSGGK